MANEIQQITFPTGWLGVGGGVRFTHDSTGFPNGFAGDTGFYVTWSPSYTATDWKNEVNLQLYYAFGFNNVTTLIQATEPIILQVEFTGNEGWEFSADLHNVDVPEIEIPNWYSNGSAAIPTVATIRDGDDTEIGDGGAKCSGTSFVQLVNSRTVSGGAVAAGVARLYSGFIASGGTVAGGSATVYGRQTIQTSGGIRGGGTASPQMIRNPATSGGVKIMQPMYGNGYTRRHTITIPANTFDNDVADFPLRISLQADQDYVTSNLIFTDESDNRLPHDLVGINSGKVFAYVRLDVQANAEKRIRMYFAA